MDDPKIDLPLQAPLATSPLSSSTEPHPPSALFDNVAPANTQAGLGVDILAPASNSPLFSNPLAPAGNNTLLSTEPPRAFGPNAPYAPPEGVTDNAPSDTDATAATPPAKPVTVSTGSPAHRTGPVEQASEPAGKPPADDSFFGNIFKNVIDFAKSGTWQKGLTLMAIDLVEGIIEKVPFVANLLKSFAPQLAEQLPEIRSVVANLRTPGDTSPSGQETPGVPVVANNGDAPSSPSEPEQPKQNTGTAPQASTPSVPVLSTSSPQPSVQDPVPASAPSQGVGGPVRTAANNEGTYKSVPTQPSGRSFLDTLKNNRDIDLGNAPVNDSTTLVAAHFDENRLSPAQRDLLNGQKEDYATPKLILATEKDLLTGKPLNGDEQKLASNAPVLAAVEAGLKVDIDKTAFGVTIPLHMTMPEVKEEAKKALATAAQKANRPPSI